MPNYDDNKKMWEVQWHLYLLLAFMKQIIIKNREQCCCRHAYLRRHTLYTYTVEFCDTPNNLEIHGYTIYSSNSQSECHRQRFWVSSDEELVQQRLLYLNKNIYPTARMMKRIMSILFLLVSFVEWSVLIMERWCFIEAFLYPFFLF